MPWTAADAARHVRGLSGHQARAWAAIANRVLTDTGSEGRAIRVANAGARRVCTRCGARHSHARGLYRTGPY